MGRHHVILTLLFTLVVATAGAQAAAVPEAPEVSGRVVALGGGPVAGATVRLYASWSSFEQSAVLGTVQTDAQGRFRIPSAAADGVLCVQAPGYGLCVTRTAVGPLQEPLEVGLKPATSLRVPLTGPDGKPAAGVKVALMNLAGPGILDTLPPGLEEEYTRASDAAGVCVIEGVPQDTQVALEVVDEHYVRAVVKVQTGDGTPAAAGPIALQPAGSYEGRLVFGDSGKPAPHVRIVGRVMEDSHNGSMAYGTTDGEGRFWLKQLHPGTLTLMPDLATTLTARYAAQVTGGIAVAPGQRIKEQKLELVAGVALRGKVTVAGSGRPVAGVRIQAFDLDPQTGGFYGRQATTAADGTYVLRVLPRQYRVELFIHFDTHQELLTPPRPRDPVPVTVDPADGATVDFRLTVNPLPGVKGVVVDEAGKPVAGALVRVSSGTDVLDRSRGEFARAKTDAAGRFQLPAVDDGMHLRANKGRLVLPEAVTIDRAHRELRLVLRRGGAGSIRMHVAGEDGKPLAGADVVLRESDMEHSYAPRWARTAADGSCVFGPLDTNRNYHASVQARGYPPTLGSIPLNIEAGRMVDDTTITLRKANATPFIRRPPVGVNGLLGRR